MRDTESNLHTLPMLHALISKIYTSVSNHLYTPSNTANLITNNLTDLIDVINLSAHFSNQM